VLGLVLIRKPHHLKDGCQIERLSHSIRQAIEGIFALPFPVLEVACRRKRMEGARGCEESVAELIIIEDAVQVSAEDARVRRDASVWHSTVQDGERLCTV
jgi:hypothetical protein